MRTIGPAATTHAHLPQPPSHVRLFDLARDLVPVGHEWLLRSVEPPAEGGRIAGFGNVISDRAGDPTRYPTYAETPELALLIAAARAAVGHRPGESLVIG